MFGGALEAAQVSDFLAHLAGAHVVWGLTRSVLCLAARWRRRRSATSWRTSPVRTWSGV